MRNKNKSLMFLIAVILTLLVGMLVALRQVLSEEQMRKMVVDFIEREVEGAQGDLAAVHLNFRRTLQVHFDDVSVSRGEEFDLKAKHVVLSIPYGNFIFRRGKFDVRIEAPVVRNLGGPTSFGALRAIELLKSVPEIVGLSGEVNAKLYQPVFEPKLILLDHYRPQINRLVVNNIGRNHEMAIEVLGDLQEGENKSPFSLIGSINLDTQTLQASLALDELSMPFRGSAAQNVKLKLSTASEGLDISGVSEDLLELHGFWKRDIAGIDVQNLFIPIRNTALSGFFDQSRPEVGLKLKGIYSGEGSKLEVYDTILPLALNGNIYQSEIKGAVGADSQDYHLTFVVPNQEGKLSLSFNRGALAGIEAKLTGFDFTLLEEHELVKKVSSLLASQRLSSVKTKVKFENTTFDRYQLNGEFEQEAGRQKLKVQLVDSKSSLVIENSSELLTVKLVDFPCHIIALALKKKSPEGVCRGQISYEREAQKGKFDLSWEPASEMGELKTLLALSMVGALEQVWNVKGIIEGDRVQIDRLGGRRFSFVGNAVGSIAAQSIKLDGLLTFKKKRISPVRIEISTQGVRQLNEEENAN